MMFSHVVLQVVDLEKSIDFYTQVLGMSLLEVDPGTKRMEGPSVTPWRGQITWVLLGYQNRTEYKPEENSYIALVKDHDRDVNAGDYQTGYEAKVPYITLIVDDLEEKTAELKEMGVEFLVENARPEHSSKIKREDYIKDPEGFIICLEEFK